MAVTPCMPSHRLGVTKDTSAGGIAGLCPILYPPVLPKLGRLLEARGGHRLLVGGPRDAAAAELVPHRAGQRELDLHLLPLPGGQATPLKTSNKLSSSSRSVWYSEFSVVPEIVLLPLPLYQAMSPIRCPAASRPLCSEVR